MNSMSKIIFDQLMERLERPCSGCKGKLNLQNIKLDGIGDCLDGTGIPMLYFTHKLCRSTMIARVTKKKETKDVADDAKQA